MDDPFTSTRDPSRRADRYQKVAGEYYDMAKAATSPFLRAYYQRTAEEYRVRATGVRWFEEQGAVSDCGA
jgi:hypothetical protein